jgi:aldehyde:ferredoxin oxidoreductase
MYSVREGLRREHDILPQRLMSDPLPDGPAKGMFFDRPALEKMKDAYYELRGWDLTTGIPTPARLHELELDDLIPQVSV